MFLVSLGNNVYVNAMIINKFAQAKETPPVIMVLPWLLPCKVMTGFSKEGFSSGAFQSVVSFQIIDYQCGLISNASILSLLSFYWGLANFNPKIIVLSVTVEGGWISERKKFPTHLSHESKKKRKMGATLG